MSIADERLYYADSYLTSFTGTVVEQRELEKGWSVQLDHSAFYPTSGGQPNDLGTLDGVPVLDVYIGDGRVWHLLDSPLEVGKEVSGKIDWQRRLDFMQQHCGQHILSAAFEQLLDIETVGFHLGDEWVTIDLDVTDLTWGEVERAELRANEVIWENRQVVARFVDAQEVSGLGLRKPPTVSRDIRIVTIDGFDNNACGGTHPRRTGEIGQIKTVKTERLRGCIRLTFVCGKRALRDYQQRVEVQRALGVMLSTGTQEMVEAVARLKESAAQARKQEQELSDRLVDVTAQALVKNARPVADLWAVFAVVEDVVDVNYVRTLTANVSARLEGRAHVVALVAELGGRIHIHAAASADSGVQANLWLRQGLAAIDGKGGGTAAIAQGSVNMAEDITADRTLSGMHEALAAIVEGALPN